MVDHHASSSSINLTPARPFAPDDFRREKRAIPAPSSTISKTPTRITPPTAPSTKPRDDDSEDVFYNSSLRNSHSSLSFQSRGTMSLDLESSSNNMIPSTTRITLQNMRDDAERHWHPLRERRQSLGPLPSDSKSALAKSSMMSKSESLQLMVPLAKAQTNQIYNDATYSSGHSSAPTTPHFAKERGFQNVHRESSSSISSRYQTEIFSRARSIISMSSSRVSLGGDSTRGLLQDSSSGEMPLLYSDGELTDTPSRKELFVRRRSRQSPLTPRQFETTNEIPPDEKMDHLRRTQKLASMLGEEWRRGMDGDWLEHSNYSSPLKGMTIKRNVLLRRQSDPLHLYPADQDRASSKSNETAMMASWSQDDEQKTSRALMKPKWKTTHSKQRSRSSIDLTRDPFHLSSPPLGIHPKAATLLGLCIFPHEQSNFDSTLKAQQGQQTNDRIAKHERYNSYSSLEMLKDSDSIVGVEEKIDTVPSEFEPASSNPSTDTNEISDLSYRQREERRRRVRKISSWLGAAVPPHLISPNPVLVLAQQKAASGYNLDEAPPLPFSDYMSGSPITMLDKDRRSSDGLISSTGSAFRPLNKAKAAVNAKFNKMVHPPYHSERISHLSPPAFQEQISIEGNITPLSERERQENVKRNLKLNSVLGEAPPKDLFATFASSPPVYSHRQRLSYAQISQGQSSAKIDRSISPTTQSPTSSSNPLNFLDKDLDFQRTRSTHLRDGCASRQYRISIDSLEYLLDKDPPLLHKLVQALEEDESFYYRNMTTQDKIANDPYPELYHDYASDMSSGNASGRTSSEDQGNFEKGQEERVRELRIRRHQKLGRWFGEALPPCEDKREVEGNTLAPKSPAIRDEEYPETPNKARNNRMAPRSAGSAQRAQSLSRIQALRKILNTIHDELSEDDLLNLEEKRNLQQRIACLQRGSVEALDI